MRARLCLLTSLHCGHAGEGDKAFCSGGDQDVRGKGGYVGSDGVPRLNVLDLQVCPLKIAGCRTDNMVRCDMAHQEASAWLQLHTQDGGVEHQFTFSCLCHAQVQIRRLPKPVIAQVAGYAVGGGHILHMMCDLTIAADNAVFGQTGPKVGSFDAGYGSTQMARLIGGLPNSENWT